MDDKLKLIKTEFEHDIASVESIGALDVLRIKFLGRKGGIIPEAFKELVGVNPEDKPVLGKRLNELKQFVVSGIDEKGKYLKKNERRRNKARKVLRNWKGVQE